jgi:antitoxin component YwqK of YwqJK toxin-antitoxin module
VSAPFSCRLSASIAALVFASCAHAVQDCEVDGQHVNPASGNTTRDKTGIMRCKDRDSGQLVREQELRAGKFVGIVRYFKDGRLEREHSVNERGNRDGRAREFGPSGHVLRDETYRDGSLIGLSRAWHANGKLRRVAFHAERELAHAEWTEAGQMRELRCADNPALGPEVDDTKLCGHAGKPATVEFFSERGVLRARTVYQAGAIVRLESFWDNGKPSAQEEVADGRRVERTFSREGVKRKEVQWALRDRERLLEREQEFHENGALVTERRWAAGQRGAELATEQSSYLNGQPRRRSDYAMAGTERTADVSEFHDNGKPAFRGRYVVEGRYRERPLGTHQRFDDQGRLRRESFSDARGRITRERELDESGGVVRDDEVFEDGSRKAHAK